MNCQEMESLIHGYLDDELDLARSLDVEQHIASCPVCAHTHRELLDLRAALRRDAPYFNAPAALRRRLAASLDKPESVSRRWLWFPRLATVAAGAVAVAFLLWRTTPPTAGQELVADHIRSLMANHLTDVPSTDQHTVKPWFNGRLDFSPAVKDLTAQGFPLIGGRLDYLAGRPVAAVVYRRRQHIINLFTWPAPGQPDRSADTSSRQGYNTIGWTRAGMSYAAVSDLNPKELTEFVHLLE